jgi:hypothetical protein
METRTGTTEHPPASGPGVKGMNALAIVSLVAGVASFVLGFIFVGAIVAIVTGHIARRQIARTTQRGGQLAVIGLVLGYAHLVLDLIWLAFLLFVRIVSAINGNG